MFHRFTCPKDKLSALRMIHFGMLIINSVLSLSKQLIIQTPGQLGAVSALGTVKASGTVKAPETIKTSRTVKAPETITMLGAVAL